jgi:phosphohistidine phosphatase
MKQLTLIRHAKAVEASMLEDDHERALRGRGRRAATELGRELAGQIPDLILCSSAARTRETVACAIAVWPHSPPVLYERDLYLESAPRLLRRLERIAPDIGGAWLVGHNPGIHDLARHLAGRAAGVERFAELTQHFPTAARAVFTIDTDRWSDLGHAPLTLVDFVVPAT